MPPSTVANDTQRSQVGWLVRATGCERHDVVDLKPNAGDSVRQATMPISLQHGVTRPLPGPAAAAATTVFRWSRGLRRMAVQAEHGDLGERAPQSTLSA